MLVHEIITEIVEPQLSYQEERGKPMPSLNHGILQSNTTFLLMLNYRAQYRIITELSLLLDDWGSTPDIAIFEPIKIDFRRDTIKYQNAPLGVIEILSPTQTIQELSEKAEMYFLKGIKSYWLVIPTLENVYVFNDPFNYQIFTKKQRLQDEVLGIELDLSELFKA
jgi:Uma2 family endonuclease